MNMTVSHDEQEKSPSGTGDRPLDRSPQMVLVGRESDGTNWIGWKAF